MRNDRPVDSHTPPQFFVEPDMILGNEVVLLREQFWHAKAQRLRMGEALRAVLGDTLYLAEVTKILPNRLVARITGRTHTVPPLWKVHLLASLLKGQSLDLVVEKTTEIGVSSITPVVTNRTIPKLDPVKAALRMARWQKVAKAASERSGRGVVTDVKEVTALGDLLNRPGCAPGKRLLAYEHEGMTVPLDRALSAADANEPRVAEVSVLIGPEGGFDSEEVEQAFSAGFVPVSLGPYIMKAETASIAAASLLIHYLSTRPGQELSAPPPHRS